MTAAPDPPPSSNVTVARVAKNSLWNITGWLFALLLSFIASPILIRMLGQDDYGLMVLLNTVVIPMGLLDFGVSQATVKYVAESIGKDDWELVGKFIRSTLFFNLIIGLLGGLVIALTAGLLATRVFNIAPESQDMARQCLYWIGLTWLVTQVQQTFLGAVTALQRYDIVNVGNLAYHISRIVIGLVTLFLGGDLLDLIRAQSVVATLAAIGWMLVAHRLFPEVHFVPRIDWHAFRKTLHFGSWQFLHNVGGILSHESQRWLLGVLLPVASVGFYNVGAQLVAVVYSAVFRVGQVFFPAVSQMQAQPAEQERAARMVVGTSWLVSSLATAGYVPIIVFAHDILSLWVGPDFADSAAEVTRVLAVGSVLSAPFAVPGFYLMGTGRITWLAAKAFAQGFITLGVSALLIPHLEVVGAGWAVVASMGVNITVLILMWFRIFRAWIPGWTYFSGIFFQLGVGLLLAGGLASLRDATLWTPNWIALGILGLGCGLCCGTLIVAVGCVVPGGTGRRELLYRVSQTIITPAILRVKTHLGIV